MLEQTNYRRSWYSTLKCSSASVWECFCLQTKVFRKILLLSANSVPGDGYDHGHLLHTNTNAAVFPQTVEQDKFVNRGTWEHCRLHSPSCSLLCSRPCVCWSLLVVLPTPLSKIKQSHICVQSNNFSVSIPFRAFQTIFFFSSPMLLSQFTPSLASLDYYNILFTDLHVSDLLSYFIIAEIIFKTQNGSHHCLNSFTTSYCSLTVCKGSVCIGSRLPLPLCL